MSRQKISISGIFEEHDTIDISETWDHIVVGIVLEVPASPCSMGAATQPTPGPHAVSGPSTGELKTLPRTIKTIILVGSACTALLPNCGE